MKVLDTIALILVIIGAVNWGLVGLFRFDLVAALFAGSSAFGSISGFSRIIYGLVGLCGLYAISFFAKTNDSHRDI
ncbi:MULTISPECIES: DUF378 domain-containing protein [Clostridium]|uniref:DUF378 domain-containing protein n=1 Tax=Clostridium senegalense TaxID=1465809 RepID=A0A6M0H5L4_9CLOT|nr:MULTISPECIES: DUF378 domain-containing protein [Clostridium]MBU5227377.1 DUF378 domain-containing protein [Clostridium senegalense]NEU06006.1 DUF378 domain-containing protein [Clostridium senegalense]